MNARLLASNKKINDNEKKENPKIEKSMIMKKWEIQKQKNQ